MAAGSGSLVAGGGGRRLDVRVTSPDFSFSFVGLDAADAKLAELEALSYPALAACLNEAGLFFEREVKLRMRVYTGRARASIGHFTPSDLTSKATQSDYIDAQSSAIFDEATQEHLLVAVGTRVVYVPILNYKLGDLMFEHALQTTVDFLPELVNQYISEIRV